MLLEKHGIIIYLHTVGSTQSLVSIARSVYFKNILYHTAYKLCECECLFFVFYFSFIAFCVNLLQPFFVFKITSIILFLGFSIRMSRSLSCDVFLSFCFFLSVSRCLFHPLGALILCRSPSFSPPSLLTLSLLAPSDPPIHRSTALDYAKVLYNCQKDVNPVFEFNVDDII